MIGNHYDQQSNVWYDICISFANVERITLVDAQYATDHTADLGFSDGLIQPSIEADDRDERYWEIMNYMSSMFVDFYYNYVDVQNSDEP